MKSRCSQMAVCAVAAIMLACALPAHIAGADGLRELSDAFTRVAEDVTPAVVSVISETERELRYMGVPRFFFDDSPLFREFFGDMLQQPNGSPPRERKQTVRGLGSGVIIDGTKGYVLTNNHVVDGADKLSVTLVDDRKFEAKVKGADRRTDLAVLQLLDLDEKLPEASLGKSATLRVGDWVVAIGSPYGLSHTVTAGIVSATGRTKVIGDNRIIQDFIQTDAAINRGNSGGPLVNLDGKVIGLNTAIASQSGGYEGIGFAIPVDMITEILDELIEKGKVTRGRLGVQIISVKDVDDQKLKALGVDTDHGAYVDGVTKGSPAEEAGIQPGDVIVEFDGQRVEDNKSLVQRTSATEPGTKVKIVVIRNGRRNRISVTMGEWTDETTMVAEEPKVEETDIGVTVQELTPELADRLSVDRDTKGVVVTGIVPGSPAQRAGLTPGSIIIEVNREPVETVAEFREALGKAQDGKSVLLIVQTEGMKRLVWISFE